MIFYHGTDAKFRKPELEKCLSYKDFGKGFYLTRSLQMAKQWAERRNRVRYNVNLYETDDDLEGYARERGLSARRFSANAEWAEFVYNNREVEGFIHPYDVVIGPVANSKIESHFARIKRGEATFEEIAETLPYAKFNTTQICLCTVQALELIKYKERYGYPQQNRTHHRNRH